MHPQLGSQSGPTVVPCLRCGAPMRETSADGSVVSVALRCEHCGATEPLPNDAAERVFLLRTLASGRSWQPDPIRGHLVSLLATFEGRELVEKAAPLGFGLLIVLASLGHSFASRDPLLLLRRSSLPGLSTSELLDIQLTSVLGMLVPIAVVVGSLLGLVFGMLRARAIVRSELSPLVLSAPPSSAGAPERCRRCGADLPIEVSALRDCTYCRAANVVSRDDVARAFVERARAEASYDPAASYARFEHVKERVESTVKLAAILGFGGAIAVAALGAGIVVMLLRS